MDSHSVISGNMLDEIEFHPLATSSEYDTVSLMHFDGDTGEGPQDLVKGRSADLLNAVKLHGNVPDWSDRNSFSGTHEASRIYPSDIKHSDIKSHESLTNTSLIRDVLRCHFCGEVLGNEETCSQDWWVVCPHLLFLQTMEHNVMAVTLPRPYLHLTNWC